MPLLTYIDGLEVLIFGLSFHLLPYFVYREMKDLGRLCIYTGSSELLLPANAISTKILCAETAGMAYTWVKVQNFQNPEL